MNHRRRRSKTFRKREFILREWCRGAWKVTKDIIHKIRFKRGRE